MWIFLYSTLFLFDEGVYSWGGSSSSALVLARAGAGAGAGPRTGPHEWVDCVQASIMCNQNQKCSQRYRVMRQCLVGKEKDMLANPECQEAMEVLLVSPLYDCRCKRAMKKELQCLQSYWSIHMDLTEGGDAYETSPYEPVTPVRHPDAVRLASIISGMHSVAPKAYQCADPSKTCNPCLDAAKACNLNNSCKKQRSTYIATCNKGEPCNRKRCHKALRLFLDRVPAEYSHRLLFCPCQDEGCAERRRQTIVPHCSFEEREKPNCLELRRTCRQEPLCRSRLADFHMNCLVTQHTVSGCPNEDNYQACLASYTGLIGTDATPNYVDASYSNWTVSPWCTCAGSGNQEGECEDFLRDFTDNTCLRNAIQAFGYSVDSMSHKADTVHATPTTRPASDATPETSEPSFNPIDMPPGDKEDKENGGEYDDLRGPEGPAEDGAAWPSADPWVLAVSVTLALAQTPALLAL